MTHVQRLAVLVLQTVFLSAALYGQAVTGSLVGTVTDASGGAVSAAKPRLVLVLAAPRKRMQAASMSLRTSRPAIIGSKLSGPASAKRSGRGWTSW